MKRKGYQRHSLLNSYLLGDAKNASLHSFKNNLIFPLVFAPFNLKQNTRGKGENYVENEKKPNSKTYRKKKSKGSPLFRDSVFYRFLGMKGISWVHPIGTQRS